MRCLQTSVISSSSSSRIQSHSLMIIQSSTVLSPKNMYLRLSSRRLLCVCMVEDDWTNAEERRNEWSSGRCCCTFLQLPVWRRYYRTHLCKRKVVYNLWDSTNIQEIACWLNTLVHFEVTAKVIEEEEPESRMTSHLTPTLLQCTHTLEVGFCKQRESNFCLWKVFFLALSSCFAQEL